MNPLTLFSTAKEATLRHIEHSPDQLAIMTKENDTDKQLHIRETYRYDEMSNKVLRADKSLSSARSDPLKDAEQSQPKSMMGRISVREMGKSLRPVNEDENENQIQIEQRINKSQRQGALGKKKLPTRRNYGKKSILEADSLSRLKYYPTDAANTDTYEEILQWTTSLLGNDIPHDIILSTADILIYSLKEDEDDMDGKIDKKLDRLKTELSISIPPQEFQALYRMTRRITDYGDSQISSEDKAVAILADDDMEEENEELNQDNELLRNEDEEYEEEELEPTESSTMPEVNISSETLRQDSVIYSGVKSERVQDLSILDVDEFFLRRKLLENMKDADSISSEKLADEIYELLKDHLNDVNLLKTRISEHMDVQCLPLLDFIIRNRNTILWGLRLSKSSPTQRQEVLDDMRSQGVGDLVEQYNRIKAIESKRYMEDRDEENDNKRAKLLKHSHLPPVVDLNTVGFDQGSKLMTVTKVELPEGSYKKVNQLYEEIHVPPPSKPEGEYKLISISEFPEWARKAFPINETEKLNVIQSEVFPAAFHNDMNILVCAPTGAGKTNVAIMSILQTISNNINLETNRVNKNKFKIVYIAPLKALVQEQVREFQRRLGCFGIKVEELTGDSTLSKQQIAETQILVSTPEKWDVVTRKAGESFSYTEMVSLIIIDEIHLLHDRRGPVLESIVARTFDKNVYTKSPRLIGLSATLPNYEDVAKFLHVPDAGLFFFDSSFRPCPLSQQFCGITEKNSIKRLHAMNEACYNKVLESVKDGHQVIIFVHSRKETARTSAWLRDKFLEDGNLELVQKNDPGTKQILSSEAENVQDISLKKVLQNGFGIHHAGLSRSDRSLSEDLFADGVIRVLVSTATLAWGVNLPAHTVIVKGTDLYSPEKGIWEQLSPQDLLQMLGRAGRPRYDTHGEGIIITNQSDVQYYLAVLNQQLPIESQLISMLVDNINAEVVSTNIKSREDAVKWLRHTYLYVRMIMSPDLYKVPSHENDDALVGYRDSLAHSALLVLHEKHLVIYNPHNGSVEATELGRIASFYYIKHSSMATYNAELRDHVSQFDLFRIFSMSEEFQYINVRQEERRELKELLENSPIPVREDVDDPLSKVNILLQAHISRLNFSGFALNADMNYVTQNAGRLIRALYQLSLKKQLSKATKMLLDMSKMVEKRMWTANSPLRQFSRCPTEVIRKAEASTLAWPDYLELQSPVDVGQAIRSEKHGKLVFDLLQRFPRIEMKCAVQPITPSLLKFELEIYPNWIWDSKIHGIIEQFVVLVEDTNGNNILFHDTVAIKKENMRDDHILNFSLQLTSSQQMCLPPNYFVSVISENWLNCESQLAVRIESIRLPKKFPAPTPLLDIPLISTSELGSKDFADIFGFEEFNKFQSQAFQAVYNSNENVLIGAAKASGKTVMAELAILNHWRQNKGRAIYISPYQDNLNHLHKNWNKRLSSLAGGKIIGKLVSDLALDLKVVSQSHLILSTPEQFNRISRRWRQKKNLQKIELVIYDDIHEVGNGMKGAVYEALIARMAFITNQLENEQRIIALASCLANGRDFGEWLGVTKDNVFNFSPHERVSPLEIHLQAFNNIYNSQFDKPMTRMAFDFGQENVAETTLIFLPTRRSCLMIGSVFIGYAEAAGQDLLKAEENGLISFISSMDDTQVKRYVLKGIGVIYEGMSTKDRVVVEKLYHLGAFSFLLSTKECAFKSLTSAAVTILGTQYYDEKEHHFGKYSVNEILEMIGITQSPYSDANGKVLILTSTNMKDYYKKFITEGLPIESFMFFYLHDLFSIELASSVIQNKQDCIDWLAYTYLYRRLHNNPSFYGVKDASTYGISAYLTELVENTLQDLEKSSIIEIEINEEEDGEEEEEKLVPLNGCMISSHYDVSFITMHTFLSSLSGASTLEDIIFILSRANEFEFLAIREDDWTALQRLHNSLPLKGPKETKFNIMPYKVFVLLQAHFSRIPLPVEFQADLEMILNKAIPLVNAIIDILSGDGRLNATTAMDLSQMIVQGVWDTDSPLKQVPFFNQDILNICADMKIETVFDIMALEDTEREKIMTMENSKLIKVANFINNYPNIELSYNVEQSNQITSDQTTTISVTITRDEAPETLKVTTLDFPFEKLESWWVVLGEVSTRELLAIRKVSLRQESQSYKLEFNMPKGTHQLTLWCICDSYLDADKEVSFAIDVL